MRSRFFQEKYGRKRSSKIIDPLTGRMLPGTLVSNGNGGWWDPSDYINALVDSEMEEEEFEDDHWPGREPYDD